MFTTKVSEIDIEIDIDCSKVTENYEYFNIALKPKGDLKIVKYRIHNF